MAETVDAIYARLAAAPEHAVLRRYANNRYEEYTATEREETLREWAAMERQRQLAEEAEAAEKTRQDMAKAAYDALKAGTATAKQTQEVVAHLLRQQYKDLAP